nr:SGNH/GDSL hydrolase family protein [Dyella sp. ASV24]
MAWHRKVLALFLLCAVGLANAAQAVDQRILFVGNSITYVNSLPAIFEQVAQAQSSNVRYHADMYVRGGATLAQLGKESALQELIDSGVYQFVVLQERGGDDLCIRPDTHWHRDDLSCDQVTAPQLALAKEAQAHGARVLYLGTYQAQPYFSSNLVSAETELSHKMDATYLEISETLRHMQGEQPTWPWLYEDHGHPGIATTMLMALRVYQAVDSSQPLHAFALCTNADLYTTKLRGHALIAHDEMTAATKPERCLLDKAQTQAIIDGLHRSP